MPTNLQYRPCEEGDWKVAVAIRSIVSLSDISATTDMGGTMGRDNTTHPEEKPRNKENQENDVVAVVSVQTEVFIHALDASVRYLAQLSVGGTKFYY